MEKDGKSYLRVIDYKSGGKKFDMSQVLSVLICKCSFTCLPFVKTGKNGTAILYRRVFLYFQAKSVEDKLSRNADDQEILEARLGNSRMDGVVLDNTDVVLGMDSSVSNHFIPVSADKGGFKVIC